MTYICTNCKYAEKCKYTTEPIPPEKMYDQRMRKCIPGQIHWSDKKKKEEKDRIADIFNGGSSDMDKGRQRIYRD